MKKENALVAEDEKEFEQLEAQLRCMAKQGKIPYPVSDNEVEDISNECADLMFPADAAEKYHGSMKKAYEDLSIEAARKKLHGEVKIFGRHIQHIRKEEKDVSR